MQAKGVGVRIPGVSVPARGPVVAGRGVVNKPHGTLVNQCIGCDAQWIDGEKQLHAFGCSTPNTNPLPGR
jgi:hypothetical protein